MKTIELNFTVMKLYTCTDNIMDVSGVQACGLNFQVCRFKSKLLRNTFPVLLNYFQQIGDLIFESQYKQS